MDTLYSYTGVWDNVGLLALLIHCAPGNGGGQPTAMLWGLTGQVIRMGELTPESSSHPGRALRREHTERMQGPISQGSVTIYLSHELLVY